MHIYLKNNPAKFHPDPIWNDGVLGLLEEYRPYMNNNNNNMYATFLDQELIL